MKRRLSLLLCVLLLSGCAPRGTPGKRENTWPVYFTTSALGSASLAAESRTVPQGAEPAEALLRILLSGPTGEGFTAPIPAGTRLLSWSIGEEGVLTVDLSERYGGLAGVDLTLADYSIALTLCQLPDVEAVSITVEGEAVSFRDHQLLRTSDVILSGAEDAPVYITASLYFPLGAGGLVLEQRDLLMTEQDSLPEVLLKALAEGPEGEGAYFPALEGYDGVTANVDSGVCYVTFPAALAEELTRWEDAEAVRFIYSIVNTFCAQESITAVHLLVDGDPVEALAGIPIAAPLEANPTLVVPLS